MILEEKIKFILIFDYKRLDVKYGEEKFNNFSKKM